MSHVIAVSGLLLWGEAVLPLMKTSLLVAQFVNKRRHQAATVPLLLVVSGRMNQKEMIFHVSFKTGIITAVRACWSSDIRRAVHLMPSVPHYYILYYTPIMTPPLQRYTFTKHFIIKYVLSSFRSYLM